MDSIFQDYDMIAVMRAVESSFYYGTTVAAMVDDAARWITEEGEPEIAANIMRAAAFRVDLFILYGV